MKAFLLILTVSFVIMGVARAAALIFGQTSELSITVNDYSVHLYGWQAEWAAFPFVLICVSAAWFIVRAGL